jgi:hypothetical protein
MKSYIQLMKLEEEFIQQTNRKLRIWIDLYKTNITDDLLEKLVNNLLNIDKHIKKLSIVGLSRINQWRIKRKLMKVNIKIPITFYSDPEEAKTWLINER